MTRNKPLVFLLLAACAGLPAAAQSQDQWTGTWLGNLKAGALSLRLVFNISVTNGALSGTMDSPDQGAKGIPVSKVTTNGNAVTLEVAVANASFSGTLAADGKIMDGAWSQSGQKFPLLLERQAGAFVLERPQEPKEPFPYKVVGVAFKSPKAGIELAGTLTIPSGKGPFPAVVLVTGSGAQNRDEELMGHKPFAVIADYLSRNGIAVLRYDDRGFAGSKGDFASATTLDFADDAEAAFTFMSSRPEVDARHVGIVGHSEGGLIAPMVAARNPKVGFIVLLAGPGLAGKDVLLTQDEAMAIASGMDPRIAADGTKVNRQIYSILAGPGDAAANAAEAKRIYFQAIDSEEGLTDQQREAAKASIDQAIAQLQTPWMKTFLAINPAEYLRKVRIPVLALNGSRDLQVIADQNLSAVDAALKEAGNTRYRIVKLDGLNHLFQHAVTGLPEEYGKITETFAPEALSLMKDFILSVK